MSRWLSTDQAAEQLGVSTKTVYRLIDRGDLPAYRMGAVSSPFRIKAEDVDNLMRLIPVGSGEGWGRS